MPDLAGIVARMAAREARAHLLLPPVMETSPGITAPATPPTSVRPVACRTCGMGPADVARHYPGPDLDCWRMSAGEHVAAGTSVLTMLACEWLSPRALLPVVVASDRYAARLPLTFRSRAAMWANGSADPIVDRLSRLDASEDWISVLGDGVAPERALAALAAMIRTYGGLTVPASTRCRPILAPGVVPARRRAVRDGGGELRWLRPSLLDPHRSEPAVADLDDFYADQRRLAILAVVAG